MKKKVISMLLATVMVVGLVAGCGQKKEEVKATGSASNDGKVLNIYGWNEEFKSRFEDYYEKAGKVPDGVKVNFVITPSENNAYQKALDEALLNQDSAKADDKVDMFLVEADYILKYVDSDYSADIKKDIGVTDADMADQYQYTKDIATDKKGIQKAISWQACGGVYIYRRSIAKAVLGTDDPAKVQEAVADWDKFDALATKMQESGYAMVSGFDDTYRTFSNNVSAPWVDGTKIVVDDKITQWIDQTKQYTDNSYNQKTILWDDAWAAGQGPKGSVFGYFMPAWGVDFVMAPNSLATAEADGGKQAVGNGIYGDWAACTGPESYNWGGTWICAAAGTDNADLIQDIMKTICCDADTMKQIVQNDNDSVNNKKVMEGLAASDYTSAFLGGQNPYGLYSASAEKIDMSNISPYDQGLNESFQTAFHDYFNGTVDKDTAMKNFITAAKEKYPELTAE